MWALFSWRRSVELYTMFMKIIWLVVSIHTLISIGDSKFDRNLSKTWKNNKFYAFRGIKYAESPTGSLRFKVSIVICVEILIILFETCCRIYNLRINTKNIGTSFWNANTFFMERFFELRCNLHQNWFTADMNFLSGFKYWRMAFQIHLILWVFFRELPTFDSLQMK